MSAVVIPEPKRALVKLPEFSSFRLAGVAFPVHQEPASHKFVNPTMLNRMQGKKRGSRDPCSVIGYWGDLCTGPFSVWGIGGTGRVTGSL